MTADPPAAASAGRTTRPFAGSAARLLGRRRRSRPPVRIVSERRASTPAQTQAVVIGILALVLALLGSVMILSASSVVSLDLTGSSFGIFVRQSLWLAIGAFVFCVGVKVDHRRWEQFLPVLVLGSIGLLVAVLVPGVGVDVNGAQRWIGLGFTNLQPSEPAKLALIVFTAAVIARNRHLIHDTNAVVRPVLVVLGLFAGLLMLQPNLGTTVLLCAIVGLMLLWGGANARFLTALGGGGVLIGLAFALSADYRRDRLTGFLDPWGNASDEGYQTIQSLIGVASGGISGTGLGESRAKWGFLPEAHTDFVFAIIGEELGLVGALVVVGLFVALIWSGVRVASRARDGFGELLAVGITAWFAVQAFVNVGAVLSLLPVTGVPLPFVSFGGSALMTNMLAAGVLANIALDGVVPEHPVRARIDRRRGRDGSHGGTRRHPRHRRDGRVSEPAPVR